MIFFEREVELNNTGQNQDLTRIPKKTHDQRPVDLTQTNTSITINDNGNNSQDNTSSSNISNRIEVPDFALAQNGPMMDGNVILPGDTVNNFFHQALALQKNMMEAFFRNWSSQLSSTGQVSSTSNTRFDKLLLTALNDTPMFKARVINVVNHVDGRVANENTKIISNKCHLHLIPELAYSPLLYYYFELLTKLHTKLKSQNMSGEMIQFVNLTFDAFSALANILNCDHTMRLRVLESVLNTRKHEEIYLAREVQTYIIFTYIVVYT